MASQTDASAGSWLRADARHWSARAGSHPAGELFALNQDTNSCFLHSAGRQEVQAHRICLLVLTDGHHIEAQVKQFSEAGVRCSAVANRLHSTVEQAQPTHTLPWVPMLEHVRAHTPLLLAPQRCSPVLPTAGRLLGPHAGRLQQARTRLSNCYAGICHR